MEIRILKSESNYLELEIEGEDHTLGNLIAGTLRRISGVSFASYYQPHPLSDKIIVKILTDGSITPKDALLKAIENIRGMTSHYIDEIKGLTK
ncbi:DNA-directed RNA polymerase subunit L [Saccharolobus solfataricus]|uniref:DNA-directed RNA polymerase subunit Rpo11 n=3 Tax=Saccharolobus solfataricus TaxID=2287 RepID=RPO11_SACS2|nr:DNA-directed RNA polymerase subunit L [Saccharolobus solfataricus]Q980K0.1 RecName: Full=DNA-directed RNA polymerase subunit Rpo11; AltName: Full=DNA-directed RNA polymerase subunit L [Saccharolobus solfataricus P2]2PA8_L Chain L, DNA-directed RNA polymerase subunit L [Saccharolobus solfataricus P2]2PMZ_L Chain L, DNA-directed RNA polymerase subunit L [Saccharolobus solfataricus P2]2PMZ_X Chain X, DNA-directed RNA polymerase subunit L [Saccharolobus solfataricus P2]3HKZ_L Chain L, DNA-direc